MSEGIGRRGFLGLAAGGLAALVEGCQVAAQRPLQQANALIDQKEYRKAITLLDKTITESPSAEAYNLRGIAYLRRGYDDKAIDAFGEAIKRDSCSATAFMNKGYAYCKKALRHRALGEGSIAEAFLEQALQDMKFAVRYAPKDAQARAYLGMIHGLRFDGQNEFDELDNAIKLLQESLPAVSER